MVRSWKDYQQAIDLVEKKQAELPLTFALTEGGNEQASVERLVFKLWDRQTFGRKHSTAFSKNVQWTIEHKSRTYSHERNTYFLEFVRTEELNEKSTSSKLWFLELVEQGVLGMVSRGAPDDNKKRQTWLKMHGYEDQQLGGPFTAQTPGVLLPPKVTGDWQFVSHMRKKTGIALFSIEPLYVAATFGMVTLSILTANGITI